ncbi:MAG: hypothetical protein QF544_07485 [Candidatus Thalassarchaeaceae archaeon]|jgi:hypothetical protein|nr:hypothetical protein [Candidatus Thalassarchaeaceae archaeon]
MTFDSELAKRRIEIEAHFVNCKDASCICRIVISLIEMVETEALDDLAEKMYYLPDIYREHGTVSDRLIHADLELRHGEFDVLKRVEKARNYIKEALAAAYIIFDEAIYQEEE